MKLIRLAAVLGVALGAVPAMAQTLPQASVYRDRNGNYQSAIGMFCIPAQDGSGCAGGTGGGGGAITAADGAIVTLGKMTDPTATTYDVTASSIVSQVKLTNSLLTQLVQQANSTTASPVNQTQIGGNAIATGAGTTNSGTQRFVPASDAVFGTNLAQVGGAAFALGSQPMAASISVTAATNGVFSGTTPAGTSGLVSSLVLKASAGALTSLNVSTTTVSGTVMVLDATALPANGTVAPKFCSYLTGQAATTLYLAWPVGTQLQFANGIVVAFSAGSSCTTLTASATAYITGGAR